MCGIAVIVDFENPPRREDVERMVRPVAHRGPDAEGIQVFPDDGVALGHRRLSILDPRPTGNQPMAWDDGALWIVHNGEVYNFVELRQELAGEGWTFRTDTDTEVILAAYRRWGEACVERFNGMYAFAIWDRRARRLFAARDRLGIKPLYYTVQGGRLFMASEVKSILAGMGRNPGPDPSLVDAYMEFGYVPGEDTLHRGVRRLLPGHTLLFGAEGLRTRKYWDFVFAPEGGRDARYFAGRVEELLADSVRLRLRSDVPLGVFLSGGIDSSTVVALLSPGARAGLKTFSVAYDYGPGYDETPYARIVAERFGTDHHEIRVSPSAFGEFVSRYVWHMDEPVTEAAAISLYYVSRLAREHVVVALSGEGSDELFAGYDFYKYNLWMERVRRWAGARGTRLLAAWGRKVARSRKVRKYLDLLEQPLERRYRGISSYETAVKTSLYSPDFRPVAAQGNPRLGGFLSGLVEAGRRWDPLSRMLYFDVKTWLVDDLLVKADRMSMATSIELRVPFLDHRLVEFAATVPSRYKIRNGRTKYLLKRVMDGRLPRQVVHRTKMGFPTPIEIMFRGDLYEYARETLLSSEATGRGYFDPRAVERMLEAHRAGREQNHREIWQLLVLEEWHRLFS